MITYLDWALVKYKRGRDERGIKVRATDWPTKRLIASQGFLMVTSFFSILLLGASGWLLDSHRRDWLSFDSSNSSTKGNGKSNDTQSKAWTFAMRRYLRRMSATGAIAFVGVLIAFWPVLPMEPRWILPYTGVLALLALFILALGCFDALASRSYYSERLREESRLHRQELINMIEADHSSKSSPSKKNRQR